MAESVKKAVVMARVSTKEQEDGYSIAAQKHRLVQYCERKGLEVLRSFELVESSTRGERRSFRDMIKFVKQQKECIAIVADKVDRVQRSFKEFPLLDALIQEGRIELHFNTENYIIHKESVSQERLMWSIGVVMAQSYVDSLRDNVKRSIDQKLRMGEWIGMAPVGYLNARDERGRSTVIPDPDRAPHIRKLFEEYSTGCYTLSELRKRSMELGLKNLRGPKKTWLTKSQLHLMVKNPFYYGVMEVKGQRYPHAYEPIITKEIYDLCQQVRLGWHKKPFRYASKEFVFRGLLTCATTGRVCTSETKTKTYPNGSTGSWTYVRCWKPDAPKKLMWVREEKLLGQIEEVFRSMRLDPGLMDDVTEYAPKSFPGRLRGRAGIPSRAGEGAAPGI